MIETKEQYKFSAEEHFIDWCTGGPWFNKTICQNLHSPMYEELFVTEGQDRYELMCVLHAYGKIIISQLMQQKLAVEYPYQNIIL